jgi:hypothetical protein
MIPDFESYRRLAFEELRAAQRALSVAEQMQHELKAHTYAKRARRLELSLNEPV